MEKRYRNLCQKAWGACIAYLIAASGSGGNLPVRRICTEIEACPRRADSLVGRPVPGLLYAGGGGKRSADPVSISHILNQKEPEAYIGETDE